MRFSAERPDRPIGIGVIPRDLPSAFDFIRGDYGSPRLVDLPLQNSFQADADGWRMALSLPARGDQEKLVRQFEDQLSDRQGTLIPLETYTNLIAASAQGWIKAEGLTDDIPAALEQFHDNLKAHLVRKEADSWGVEWLTSGRPIKEQGQIPSQDVREARSMRDYLGKFKNGGLSSGQFFLEAAGDFVINAARLATSPDQYARWQQTADAFVKKNRPQ